MNPMMVRGGMQFMQLNLTIDLIMNFVFVIFALFIFYKTKEIYELTKYKGIRYFRYSFLFLGLAYFFRAFSMIIRHFFFKTVIGKFSSFFLWSIPISFFGILAMLYLFLSLDWKHFVNEKHEYLFYIFALFLSVIFFITRSNEILVILQIVTLLVVIIVHLIKNRKNIQKMFVIYSLLIIFWILNLFSILPKGLFPFYTFLIIQIFSLIIIIYIFFRVLKWVNKK